jgi:hypothetical protein
LARSGFAIQNDRGQRERHEMSGTSIPPSSITTGQAGAALIAPPTAP